MEDGTPAVSSPDGTLTRRQVVLLAALVIGGLVVLGLWLLLVHFVRPYAAGYSDTSGGGSSEMSNDWIYSACSDPAAENYNWLDWSQGWPPPDVNRRAESYMAGCLDGARGNPWAPWHALRGAPE